MHSISIKIITVSLLSTLLSLIDLGEWWHYVQPFWLLAFYMLLLLKYDIKAPLYIALLLGCIIDSSSGTLLGQHALALIVSSFIILINRKYILFANMFTTGLYIIIISSVYLLVLLIPQLMMAGWDVDYRIVFSPLSTALAYSIISSLRLL